MKILLVFVGKTTDKNIKVLLENYIMRIMHYVPFEVRTVDEPKNTANLTHELQCAAEGEAIRKILSPDDYVVLLDEHGREYRSVEFAGRLTQLLQSSSKRIVFIIGGPYGFASWLKTLSREQISLSRMTFSHQMVRLIFAEQFYRALTIIKGEPYHHE